MADTKNLAQRATAIAKLFESFGKASNKVILAAYVEGTEDLSIEQLEYAVRQSIKTCDFLPKVSQIRRQVELDTATALEAKTAKAFAALDRLCDDYANLGENQSVVIDDVELAETVRRMGGLNILSRVPKSDFHTWKRKEFSDYYQCVVAENQAGELTPRIIDAGRAKQNRISQSVKGIGAIVQQLPFENSLLCGST